MRSLSMGALVLWALLSLYSALSGFVAETSLTRSRQLAASGRYDAAYAVAARAWWPVPAETYQALGTSLRLSGLFRARADALEAGLAMHERAVAHNPLDSSLYQDLAWAALQTGDPHRAEEAARAANARDPHNAYGLYVLGRSLEAQGRSLEAAGVYRDALAARRDPVIAARLRQLETER